LRNPRCWVQHMQLNYTTGLDPDGIRLRASECAAHHSLWYLVTFCDVDALLDSLSALMLKPPV